MRRAAIISFRLGGSDGVSIEAEKWRWALAELDFDVATVAGEGVADTLVDGLGMRASGGPDPASLTDAIHDADVVVVENLCSLPLNPVASRVVAELLVGRPAVFHHHDLPWQREQFFGWPPPPDDPAWRHVTVNEKSRLELAEHGIGATTIYNRFDPDPPEGRRDETRAALGVSRDARLVLQPTRALERKRVEAAVGVAETLGATYWLLGPPEDGYGPTLERIVASARCPVRRGAPELAHGGTITIADAYAACDLVTLTSNVEGFGNPAVESATHRRPLVIGPYAVAAELRAFGFEWFTESPEDLERLAHWLESPDRVLLDRNAEVARRHFGLATLPAALAKVLAGLPGPPARSMRDVSL